MSRVSGRPGGVGGNVEGEEALIDSDVYKYRQVNFQGHNHQSGVQVVKSQVKVRFAVHVALSFKKTEGRGGEGGAER